MIHMSFKSAFQSASSMLARAFSKQKYEQFGDLWFKQVGAETTYDKGLTIHDKVWQCLACGKQTIAPGRHAWAHEQLRGEL